MNSNFTRQYKPKAASPGINPMKSQHEPLATYMLPRTRFDRMQSVIGTTSAFVQACEKSSDVTAGKVEVNVIEWGSKAVLRVRMTEPTSPECSVREIQKSSHFIHRHSMYAIYAYIDLSKPPQCRHIWHTWSVWERYLYPIKVRLPLFRGRLVRHGRLESPTTLL